MQLTVCRNGVSGINFEHSWGDGVAVLRFFNDIFEDSVDNPSCSPAQLVSIDSITSNFRKLDLTLNSSLETKISSAKEKFDKAVNSLDMATIQVFSFGKEYIKNKKLSPDAVMQLGFQVGIK